MQRRNSTRSSNSLNRQKSACSAKSVRLEHILPELAERDAQAAAMQAFARAKDRGSTDASLWPPSRNSGLETSNSSRPPRCAENRSPLRRQQTVRYFQPKPLLASKSNANSSDSIRTGHSGNSCYQVTEANVGPRSETNTFAPGMDFVAKGTAGDYIDALVTSEEYYTPEDNIASVPSSYRRIRKARSMITTSHSGTMAGFRRGHHTSAANYDWPRSLAIVETKSDENQPPTGLKSPRSMSFLKGRRDQYTSSNSQEPAFGSRAVGNKHFKKSLRDASNEATSISLRVPRDGVMRNKARKASNNLKHKFKNLFNLGKEEKHDVCFPPQQIHALKTHNTNIEDSTGHKDDIFQTDPSADEGALSRVTSGVPSLHAVPSNQQLRSRQGSVESLGSERWASDERSRVTSWSNSDTNTVTTVNSLREKGGRQRLSIIKENGAHITSSRRAPAINSPIQIDNSGLPPQSRPLPTVDGHRIYSALMKRVNGKRKQSQSRMDHKNTSVEDVEKTGCIPPRGSSNNCDNQGLQTSPTIRHVTDDDSDRESVRTTETVITPFRYEESRTDSTWRTDQGNEEAQERRMLPSGPKSPSLEGDHKVGPGDSHFLTVSSSGRKNLPVRNLSTRKSLFFGSPTCHLFRAKSPYRRAIQGSMKAAEEAPQPKSPEFNPWSQSLTNLHLRCPSTCESEVDQKMQYAKSIYSCATEEPRNTSNHTMAINEDRTKTPSTSGEATIFTESAIYRRNPSIPPVRPMPPRERITSSTSSVDWKTWLSANVSKLEESPIELEDKNADYGVPSMTFSSRHVREDAQIVDEENEEGFNVYQPTRPGDPSRFTERNSKLPTYLPRLVSNAKPGSSSSDKENEAPYSPPIPPRNVLRTTPSSSANGRSSLNKRVTLTDSSKHTPLDSTPRKTVAHMRSLNALEGNSPREPTNTASGLPRRQTKPIGYTPPMASPGIAAAVDKQFGAPDELAIPKRSVATEMAIKSENVSPRVGANKLPCDGEAATSTQGAEARLGPQGSTSKRMVDLFLNSRRRRIASSDEGSVFL